MIEKNKRNPIIHTFIHGDNAPESLMPVILVCGIKKGTVSTLSSLM